MNDLSKTVVRGQTGGMDLNCLGANNAFCVYSMASCSIVPLKDS